MTLLFDKSSALVELVHSRKTNTARLRFKSNPDKVYTYSGALTRWGRDRIVRAPQEGRSVGQEVHKRILRPRHYSDADMTEVLDFYRTHPELLTTA